VGLSEVHVGHCKAARGPEVHDNYFLRSVLCFIFWKIFCEKCFVF
jgi:hypothetical protein